jgi:hypothetical protein
MWEMSDPQCAVRLRAWLPSVTRCGRRSHTRPTTAHGQRSTVRRHWKRKKDSSNAWDRRRFGVTSVVCGAINGRSDHHTHTQTLTENYHKIPVATGVQSTRKMHQYPGRRGCWTRVLLQLLRRRRKRKRKRGKCGVEWSVRECVIAIRGEGGLTINTPSLLWVDLRGFLCGGF